MAAWNPARPARTKSSMSAADPAVGNLSNAARVIGSLLENENYRDHLAVVTEQIALITGADGVAIALRENTGAPVTCVESWGMAPEKGVTVSESAGLCGECIRTGTLVRCDDSLHDSRVAAMSALRSVVVVPVWGDPLVQGILTLFSATPYAFSDAHVALLKFAADVLSATVAEEKRVGDRSRETLRPTLVPAPLPQSTATRRVQPPPQAAQPRPHAEARSTAVTASSTASPDLRTLTEYEVAGYAARAVAVVKRGLKRYKDEIRLGVIVLLVAGTIAGFIVAADQRGPRPVQTHSTTSVPSDPGRSVDLPEKP